VLDDGVHVVSEAVGVLDLLEDLAEHLLRRLPGVELDLRVQPEPHRAPRFAWDMAPPPGEYPIVCEEASIDAA
jgi:hypothetical protein